MVVFELDQLMGLREKMGTLIEVVVVLSEGWMRMMKLYLWYVVVCIGLYRPSYEGVRVVLKW